MQFYIQSKGLLEKLNSILDSVFNQFSNSFWFCSYSMDRNMIIPKQIKFPMYISFREATILCQIQHINNPSESPAVSSLPSVFMLDEFCFKPISIILSLYCIGYFQNKFTNTLEEKYFQEILLQNKSPISKIAIAKIISCIN